MEISRCQCHSAGNRNSSRASDLATNGSQEGQKVCSRALVTWKEAVLGALPGGEGGWGDRVGIEAGRTLEASNLVPQLTWTVNHGVPKPLGLGFAPRQRRAA